MRLVEPWIKVENFDGVKIMKRIERACRTCYRSEDKISDESYKNLLTNVGNTKLCGNCGKRFEYNTNCKQLPKYCSECAKRVKNEQNKEYYHKNKE